MSSALPLLLQTEEDGGNQLPVRPQEAAFKARGPGADQRDHQEGELRRDISGGLHSWSGATKTCVHVQVGVVQSPSVRGVASQVNQLFPHTFPCQVLASLSKPQEACGSEILPPEQKYDPAKNNEALQTTRCKVTRLSWPSLEPSRQWQQLNGLSLSHTEHKDPRAAADGEAGHPSSHRAAPEVPGTFPARTFYGRRGSGSLVFATGEHNRHICRRGIRSPSESSRFRQPVW